MSVVSRRILHLVSVVACAALVASCSGSGSNATDTSTNVAFHPCSEVDCAGALGGAAYQILMPTTWNGTLLLYSHGYRNAQPAPPSYEPVVTSAEPAPGWSEGEKSVGQALLDQGYALAGSAYASNGWAVQDGVKADEDLYAFFSDKVARPTRVYAWGDSLGGLITAELTERHPDWVSGSAPLCGALAGLNPNMDLALDVEYAVRELIWPGFKVSAYSSYQDAVTNFSTAASKVLAAAKDVKGGGTAKILFIASLADAPLATKNFDGSTITSQVQASAEGVLTALGFGTYGRYDIEQRVGGNPSSNATTEYALRFTVADQRRIDTVTPGATKRYALAMARGKRISADPAARAKAATLGDPKGAPGTPTITLHTFADPLVIVQNESWYAARVAASAQGTSKLAELVTVPPATFAQSPGAPYGAGHCNFTAQSRIGVITILDDWVRRGVYPGSVSEARALGSGSGFVPDVAVPVWPLGGDRPTT
jgi:alpha-beta hydrolase superfamily lysophospholipase